MNYQDNLATFLLNLKNIKSLKNIEEFDQKFKKQYFYNATIDFNDIFSQIYLEFGNQFIFHQKKDLAIEYFKQCLEFNQSNIIYKKQCIQKLALLYSQKNQLSETVKYFIQLSELAPLNHNVLFNIGLTFSKLNRHREALQYYYKAQQLKQNDLSTVLNLGASYFKLNGYEKAIECYLKAVSIDNMDSRAYFNLGIVYNKQKNYKNAILYFRKVLSLIDPKSSLKTYYNLAECYILMNDYENANQTYLDAKQSHENNSKLYTDFGYLYIINQQNQQGMHILLQGYANIPQFLNSVENKEIKKNLLLQIRRKEMKFLKIQLLALKTNQIYTKLFRREINNEIVELLEQTKL